MRALTGWRRFWLFIGLSGLLLGAGGVSVAAEADAPRIGVVDLDRLIQESPQAERAKDNMAKRFAARKIELEDETAALRKAVDRLDARDDKLSREQVARRRAALEKRRDGLQNKQQTYNADVAAAENKELERMRRALITVIDAYAKAHGYDLILGDSALYAADSIDVTDAVLARLRAK